MFSLSLRVALVSVMYNNYILSQNIFYRLQAKTALTLMGEFIDHKFSSV